MEKNNKVKAGKDGQNRQSRKSSPMTDEEYAEHVMKLFDEWNASHPSSHEEIDYAKEEAAQIVYWKEHPEVYERWLRAHEPSRLWKELRAIKCKFMGLPYSDWDLE